MKEPCQPDMFKTLTPENFSPPITIELKGLGPIPSFKNRKLIRSWMDKSKRVEQFLNGHWWIRKDSIKLRSMLYLEPELQAWMDRATSVIASQLLSAIQTTIAKTQTAACPRSLIATLLPSDDCWTSFQEVIIKNELVSPDQVGAKIVIERI